MFVVGIGLGLLVVGVLGGGRWLCGAIRGCLKAVSFVFGSKGTIERRIGGGEFYVIFKINDKIFGINDKRYYLCLITKHNISC